MRVHIQRGQWSIEIEGEPDEIHKILERWWEPQPEDNFDQETNETDDPGTEKGNQKKVVRKKKTNRAPRKPSSDSENQHRADHNAIANDIRQDPNWPKFDEKIVSTEKASRSQKAKFILWFTHEKALTSGDIMRVLNSLGVKMDAPTASKAMNDSKNDFIRDDAGPAATFRLTGLAKKKFEEWLLGE